MQKLFFCFKIFVDLKCHFSLGLPKLSSSDGRAGGCGHKGPMFESCLDSIKTFLSNCRVAAITLDKNNHGVLDTISQCPRWIATYKWVLLIWDPSTDYVTQTEMHPPVFVAWLQGKFVESMNTLVGTQALIFEIS